MTKFKTHYPNFNVMNEKEHWDPHTREIVEKRTERSPYNTLTHQEVLTLYKICTHLLADERESVLTYVIQHFDQTLTADIGQAQRKKGVPKQSVLIREGLRALDLYATAKYGRIFAGLEEVSQRMILLEMENDSIQLEADGIHIPAKELFLTLLLEAVSAYYSHPDIWSEIGYAGPAYPRGYVRSEWGLTDPWEARREDEK
jgi:hypothetical protein